MFYRALSVLHAGPGESSLSVFFFFFLSSMVLHINSLWSNITDIKRSNFFALLNSVEIKKKKKERKETINCITYLRYSRREHLFQ